MGNLLRLGVIAVILVSVVVGGTALAVNTPLPTEFTSGGVRWGDLTEDDTGFYNNGRVCLDPDGFAMGDAFLLATNQDDTFDDAGLVNVDGSYYLVPGGSNGPVDLTGSTLTAPVAATGSLNVGVQWQGVGPGTIRELVSLTNPGATDVTKEIVLETNLGSDGGTRLQASSTGDISAYPTNARWFATSDSDTSPADPPIVSVATGPGTVRSPATISECPPSVDSASKDAAKAAKANATEAATTTTTIAAGDAPAATSTDVSAAGTPLFTDNFTYRYSVAIPAGQTRFIMVFWSLFATNAEAVSAGPTWNTNPTVGSDPLSGLSSDQLQQIVNWAFPLALVVRFTG
jgi:hypothetical protein